MKRFCVSLMVGVVLALVIAKSPISLLGHYQGTDVHDVDQSTRQPVFGFESAEISDDSVFLGELASPAQSERHGESAPASIIDQLVLDSWPKGLELARAFDQDSRDSLWAADAESRLFQGISEIDLPLMSVGVHCRSKICRVELVINASNSDLDGSESLRLVVDPLTSERRTNSRLNKSSAHTFYELDMFGKQTGLIIVQAYAYHCPEEVSTLRVADGEGEPSLRFMRVPNCSQLGGVAGFVSQDAPAVGSEPLP